MKGPAPAVESYTAWQKTNILPQMVSNSHAERARKEEGRHLLRGTYFEIQAKLTGLNHNDFAEIKRRLRHSRRRLGDPYFLHNIFVPFLRLYFRTWKSQPQVFYFEPLIANGTRGLRAYSARELVPNKMTGEQFMKLCDFDTLNDEILLAARQCDLVKLKPLLGKPGAASVSDPDTGMTPLHSVVVGVYDAAEELKTEHKDEAELQSKIDDLLKNGCAVMEELLFQGAIWNDLDLNDETPGCTALRLGGLMPLYEVCVRAGLRAELLLDALGDYDPLDSDDEASRSSLDADEHEGSALPTFTKVERSLGGTLLTIQDEDALPCSPDGALVDVNSADYLASALEFTDKTLLDADKNGVMMDWETPIMKLTAELIAPKPGLRVLNVGYGMGIIDGFLAATNPSTHHIIEAHPSVLAHLQSPTCPFGPSWQSASSADGTPIHVIHAGKWQDIVTTLIAQEEVFDVIYFDTFGESYAQLKFFFEEIVIALLAPAGRFSFFHGLGADRMICYDVYTKVVEIHMEDAGLAVEWIEVPVERVGMEVDGEGEWRGVRRRYWTCPTYRLPVCRFLGAEDEEEDVEVGGRVGSEAGVEV